MARQLKPCGTNAAYRRHLKWGEEPCEPCKKAGRKDCNDQYHNNPETREYRKWRMRTRNDALRILAGRHHSEALILKGELPYTRNRSSLIREELKRRYPEEFQGILLTIRDNKGIANV